MKLIILGSILISHFLPVLSVQAELQKAPIRFGGLYSNLAYSEDSGDLGGHEIFIIYTESSYWVVSQCSEGAPLKPNLVPAKRTGNNTLEFSLKGNGICSGKFVVTIKKNTADIKPNLYGSPLKKGHSYWH